MTTHRELLYTALRESTDLAQLVGDRIFAASALVEGKVPPRPFVTYRMHTRFGRPLGRPLGAREYVQLWANDNPGDYLRIDKILELSRKAVEAIPQQDTFLEARWIETGVDLRDPDMGTINRYIRFQFTSTLREYE